jgi:hypothetical protein
MLTVSAALVVLLVALMLDPDNFAFMVNPEVQVVLGILVIAIILFHNAASGLILGIAVLIMYLRVHSKQYGVDINLSSMFRPLTEKLSSAKYPMGSLVKNYITPQNLIDAQNNIYDKTNFTTEMKGIKGVYGEPVYGAQGTDKTMPGYDSYAPGSLVKS